MYISLVNLRLSPFSASSSFFRLPWFSFSVGLPRRATVSRWVNLLLFRLLSFSLSLSPSLCASEDLLRRLITCKVLFGGIPIVSRCVLILMFVCEVVGLLSGTRDGL